MYKFAAVIALLFAACAANAANYQGIIGNVTPYNGRLFISVNSGGFDGAASTCFTNATSMVYSVDASTVTGKAILAVALSAKLTSKQVYVFGDTTCPAGGNPYNGTGSENMVGIDLKG
jgi:hypothetical protein